MVAEAQTTTDLAYVFRTSRVLSLVAQLCGATSDKIVSNEEAGAKRL